eukprot:8803100-Alexandrium_andersonii.AAC.1
MEFGMHRYQAGAEARSPAAQDRFARRLQRIRIRNGAGANFLQVWRSLGPSGLCGARSRAAG